MTYLLCVLNMNNQSQSQYNTSNKCSIYDSKHSTIFVVTDVNAFLQYDSQ